MGWYGSRYGFFKPYVSVGTRRANAEKKIAKLQKKGQSLSPVTIAGSKITQSVWGKAWCDNLESYSDYSNRLDRGRSYVRHGLVIDLQIKSGKITALVSGSELYKVEVSITKCAAKLWKRICQQCSGQIGSMIDLLKGMLSTGVMQIITSKKSGLFPSPSEIKLSCSCPDGAYMCKHIAATLYGVGARLDTQPELLFKLRQVDHLDLLAHAGNVNSLVDKIAKSGQKTLGENDLGDVFGVDMEPAQPQIKPAKVLKSPEKKVKNKSKPSPLVKVKATSVSVNLQKNKKVTPQRKSLKKSKETAPDFPGR